MIKALRRVAVPMLLASVWGCGGGEEWAGRIGRLDLAKGVESSLQSPSCKELAPMLLGSTQGASFPIPTERTGRLFGFLIYDRDLKPGAAAEERIAAPKVTGGFAIGTIEHGGCRKFEPVSKADPGLAESGAARALSPNKRNKMLHETYVLIERLSQPYFDEKPLDAAAKADAETFVRNLTILAEPGLLSQGYYYAVSPEFWDWLEAGAGVAVPKPAELQPAL